jgi:hypothetical protein
VKSILNITSRCLAKSLITSTASSQSENILLACSCPANEKSLEPLAAQIDPSRVYAKHQSLHHFTAAAAWSDRALLRAICQYALPALLHLGEIECWLLSARPLLWLFVLAPVLTVLQVFNSLRIAVVGEEFTFDGVTRTVLKNQKRLAGFNEIAYLQIRTIQGKSADHRLTAVLQTSDKIEIHTSSNTSEIIALADDVADILGVRVVRKE